MAEVNSRKRGPEEYSPANLDYSQTRSYIAVGGLVFQGFDSRGSDDLLFTLGEERGLGTTQCFKWLGGVVTGFTLDHMVNVSTTSDLVRIITQPNRSVMTSF